MTDDAGTVTGLLKMAMQMITAQPSAGTAEPNGDIRLTIMAFLYRPFRPLSLTLTNELPLAGARGSHALRYATNDRGTSGQSVSFTIDIDTQPPVLEGTAVGDASATDLPALRS